MSGEEGEDQDGGGGATCSVVRERARGALASWIALGVWAGAPAFAPLRAVCILRFLSPPPLLVSQVYFVKRILVKPGATAKVFGSVHHA